MGKEIAKKEKKQDCNILYTWKPSHMLLSDVNKTN